MQQYSETDAAWIASLCDEQHAANAFPPLAGFQRLEHTVAQLSLAILNAQRASKANTYLLLHISGAYIKPPRSLK